MYLIAAQWERKVKQDVKGSQDNVHKKTLKTHGHQTQPNLKGVITAYTLYLNKVEKHFWRS